MHFIVVDPNAAFATLLTEELQRLGYDTTACGSGGEALASARAQQPDMALLDMALERPDALTVARQLRSIHPGMRLMFIPLMGEKLQLDGDAPPFQGVLPKPFFLPELPQHIQAALEVPVGRGGAASKPVRDDAAGAPPVGRAAERQPPATPSVTTVPESLGGAPVVPMDPPQSRRKSAGEMHLSYDVVQAHRARVETLMQELMMDVGADGVLLTGSEGLLAWVGGLAEDEVNSISQAVLHGWQTSAEVARILGREQLRFEQSIAGGSYMLYALSVQDAILAVTVDGTSALGLLRHRARSTAQRIAKLCAV
jgi:CheY-like chemotaxis protein/predicted regulator of Ras-like GTPase activity (Roadblock/LC7/MglB family)